MANSDALISEGLNLVNVLQNRGDASGVSATTLQQTDMSQTQVVTIRANFDEHPDEVHEGDQILYVVEGRATARVSGHEQEIGVGDLLMIPGGAPHTLMTGAKPLLAVAIFAPPKDPA